MSFPRFLLFMLIVLPQLAKAQDPLAEALVHHAFAQIGVTVRYDPAYRVIAFPAGDVPRDRGVCSDVVIRAYRDVGIDLQFLVNRDMRRHFSAYPKLWGLKHPDANIDHRRVPNLAAFFARNGKSLPINRNGRDYLPGDIVTWRLPAGEAHIGMVSDKRGDTAPLMLHNIGAGTQLEDVLFRFTITGHYRYLPTHI